MILFTEHSRAKILSGKKTQTRRCWLRPRVKVGAHHWAQLNLDPGTRFARLKILSITEWDGHFISLEDALAEGFEDELAFLAAYYALNSSKYWDINRKHYAIEFEVMKIKNEKGEWHER